MLLVFCEGKGDEAFFKELIRVRNLSNVIVKVVGGKDNYSKKLRNDIPEITRMQPQYILFTGDNDKDPKASFEAVRSAVESLNNGIRETGSIFKIPVPKKPKLWTGRKIKSAIYMMPASGKAGALESLLLKYLVGNRPNYQQCSDSFVQCIEAQRRNDIDKIKLRLFLCAITKDPNVGIAYLWSDKKWKNPEEKIDLANPIFDDIANFLRKGAHENTRLPH